MFVSNGKNEDLNIQIQYKLIEELKKTNEDLQLKIKDEQAIGNKLKSTIAHLNLVNEFAQLIQKANNTSDIVWAITKMQSLNWDLKIVSFT